MSKRVVWALLLMLFAFKVPRLLVHGFYLTVIAGLVIALVNHL